MSNPTPTESTKLGSGSGPARAAADTGAAKAAVVVPVAETPAARTTTTMAGPRAVAKAQEGEGKGREGRAAVKKSWVEELRKAVEGKEGNSAIADSDEESDIEAPAAPIHRRQRQQARADHRRQAPKEDEEEKARYASVESAIAFLREHGVDAKDFAK